MASIFATPSEKVGLVQAKGISLEVEGAVMVERQVATGAQPARCGRLPLPTPLLPAHSLLRATGGQAEVPLLPLATGALAAHPPIAAAVAEVAASLRKVSLGTYLRWYYVRCFLCTCCP